MDKKRLRLNETVKTVLEQQSLGHLRLNAQFECVYITSNIRKLWGLRGVETPFCMYRALHHDRLQAAMLHIENALHLHKTIAFDVVFDKNPVRLLAVGDGHGVDVYHYPIEDAEVHLEITQNTWELLDRLPVGILVIEIANNQFVHINQHLERILGYTKQDIQGKSFSYLHSDDDLDEILQDYQRQLEGKLHFSRPIHFLKKEGGSMEASVTQIPIEIDHKKYVVCVLKDRAFFHQQLQSNYQNISADEVLSSFPNTVMVFEEAGYLIQHYIKPKDVVMQSLSVQLGLHYSEIFPSTISGQITEKFECIYKNQKPCEWELGIKFDHEDNFYKVRLFLLSKNYFLLVLIDITNEKKQELALIQSEKQFRDIFDRNEATMFMYDPESLQMLDVNESGLRFYGYDRETFLKLKLTDIKDSNSELDEDIALIVSKTKNHFTYKHRLSNGTTKEVEIFATTLEADGKKIVCSIIQDITERQAYLQTIVEQNRIIRDIAWTHAHQLRAPISKLQALIEYLSNEADEPYISTQRMQQELIGISRQIDATLTLLAEKTKGMEQVATQIPDFTRNPKSKIRKCEALVVDDDTIMLTLHSHLIKKSGLFENPKLFNSGALVLDYLLKNDIRWLHFVVFLDLNMPEMNGWEFIQQARKRLRHAQIYVVIVSSSNDPFEKEMAKTYEEVIDFISKPLQTKHMTALKALPIMQRLLSHQ